MSTDEYWNCQQCRPSCSTCRKTPSTLSGRSTRSGGSALWDLEFTLDCRICWWTSIFQWGRQSKWTRSDYSIAVFHGRAHSFRGRCRISKCTHSQQWRGANLHCIRSESGTAVIECERNPDTKWIQGTVALLCSFCRTGRIEGGTDARRSASPCRLRRWILWSSCSTGQSSAETGHSSGQFYPSHQSNGRARWSTATKFGLRCCWLP